MCPSDGDPPELKKGPLSGSEKRGLLEKGSFQKSPFSREFREFRDSRDSREPPDCGNHPGHFLEILENLEILEILEIPPARRPVRNDPFFWSRLKFG